MCDAHLRLGFAQEIQRRSRVVARASGPGATQ